MPVLSKALELLPMGWTALHPLFEFFQVFLGGRTVAIEAHQPVGGLLLDVICWGKSVDIIHAVALPCCPVAFAVLFAVR